MDNQEIRDEIRKRSMDIPVPDSLHPDQIEKKLENTKQRRPSAAKRLRSSSKQADGSFPQDNAKPLPPNRPPESSRTHRQKSS